MDAVNESHDQSSPTSDFRQQQSLCSSNNQHSMDDIPPEVLTDILEYLVRIENNPRNLLGYRNVNSAWKIIIDRIVDPKIMLIRWEEPTLLKIPNNNGICHTSYKPFPIYAVVLKTYNKQTELNYGKYSSKDKSCWLTVDQIMPRFTANLTSFELKDIVIDKINLIFTLLGSMQTLRIFSLTNVCMTTTLFRQPFILPKLPALSHLTCLKIQSSYHISQKQKLENSNILYLYIVATYAEQLQSLIINTATSLPPLKQDYQYHQPYGHFRRLNIISTSHTAFTKLKDLTVSLPSKNFLDQSNFPNLERLSLSNVFIEKGHPWYRLNEYPRDIRVIANFINKFRTTLKSLYIDASWQQLIGRCAGNSETLDGRIRFEVSRIMDGPFHMLTSIEVHYPTWYLEEIMMSGFIRFFPNIKEIHFLFFPKQHVDIQTRIEKISNIMKNQKAYLSSWRFSQLKSELTAVNQRILDCDRRCNQLLHASEPLQVKLNKQERKQVRKLKRQYTKEQDSILFQLSLFGEWKQNIVMEQLLLLLEIWKTCPLLKRVTASMKENPEEVVSVIRRLMGAETSTAL